MEIDKKYVTNLVEKVYFGRDSDTSDGIGYQLEQFFDEVVRRKNKKQIDGLQAAMVIYPDAFAAKVNENDGDAPHQNSYVNLTKYLNGDSNFLNGDGIRRLMLYTREMRQLVSTGIEVFIRTPEDNLEMGFIAFQPIQSIFQLDVLKLIVDECMKLMDSNSFKTIFLGMNTLNTHIEFDEFNRDRYSVFIDAIESEKALIRNR